MCVAARQVLQDVMALNPLQMSATIIHLCLLPPEMNGVQYLSWRSAD